MLGIYLGAYKAVHLNYNIVYQDINNFRDIGGCMLDKEIHYNNSMLTLKL